MAHVTIIGGGIAGLSTAFYLQKYCRQAGKPIDYTLIEQQPRFGGKIITETVDNFVIEGGPDSFVTIKPGGTQLCRDLGLGDEIIPTNDEQRNVFVLKKGTLTPFPGGYRLTVPTEFIPFALSPLISPLGKLRMGADLFIPPRTETSDESLGSFIRRRLGEEALDRIAGPIMAGIYVADPDKLSMQSTFPQFIEMERQSGSLIKAMQKAKKRKPLPNTNNSSPSAMFTSLQGGMNELVNTLVNQLNGDLHTSCRVSNLHHLSPEFEVTLGDSGKSLKTDAVVLAIPAYVSAGLLEQTAPELSQLLRQIRYVSTATISLGYRSPDLNGQHDFNGFGFVIPKSENRQILACTWSSTKFNYRAPDDHVLLRAFVGGDNHEHLVNLPDDELLNLVRSEIAATMHVTATPVVQKVFRWKNGNPQYDVGHLDRVAKMEALAATIPRLYLTGSAFRGIGIPDCVKNAQATVEQILSDFS